jgi:hypothetical protein
VTYVAQQYKGNAFLHLCGKNGYVHVPQCYVRHTLPILQINQILGNIKIAVFWNFMPCCMGCAQHTQGTCYFHGKEHLERTNSNCCQCNAINMVSIAKCLFANRRHKKRDVFLTDTKRQVQRLWSCWLRHNTKPRGKKVKLKVQYKMITKWTMMHEQIIGSEWVSW